MRRLTTRQRLQIKEHYLQHWFYSHIAAPAKMLECRLNRLRISPEELFVECMTQLDRFLDDPEQYAETWSGMLWEEYFCQLREMDPQPVPEEELTMGTAGLVYLLNYLFCSLADRPVATQVGTDLTVSLMSHMQLFDAMDALFRPKLWTRHQGRFLAMLQQYAGAKERLSTTLARQLEEWARTPAPAPADGAEGAAAPAAHTYDEHPGNRFTQRQTVMLVQELLNISLDTQDTNVSELSRFIHRLTGYDMGSIRSAIHKLRQQEHTPPRDLRTITEAIEPFNAKLARDIRERNE